MASIVSIIIPTKNRRELLRETIASVVGQMYPHWESIVVDDGSSDGTEEMVREMALIDKRIKFALRGRKPHGASTCRNIGISLAVGEYVIFLDSDDLLATSCLEHRVKVMEQNPKMDFAVFLTQVFYTMPGDSPYLWNIFSAEDDLDRFLRRDQPWHTSGPLWRKASLARIGLWDERALCAQDWEFHIRAIAAGLNYVKVPEADSFWRASKPGAISNSWMSRRHVCNRVRLFKRIITILRSKNLMTERRRRILASEYYDHAFRFTHGHRLALKIWIAGWRAKVVGNIEFIIVLSGEVIVWVVQRMNRFILGRLFPERQIARTHTIALPPTTSLEKSDAGKTSQVRIDG